MRIRRTWPQKRGRPEWQAPTVETAAPEDGPVTGVTAGAWHVRVIRSASDALMDDDDPLALSGRLWPAFEARTVAIAPGSSRPYDEAEWRDALVVVKSGEVQLETIGGYRRRFGPGDMLWLTGLSLRCLHNVGTEPVVLKAVSRRDDNE